MENIKNLLSYGLLFVFLTKMLLVTPSIADMGIVISLCSVCALQFYLEKHHKLKEVVQTVNEQNKVIEKMATEFDSLRTSVASVKLGQSFKKVV